MKLVKTDTGQRVLKDRSVALSQRQRAAFILCDGNKTVEQVLAATVSMGVTAQDVDQLVSLGLLAPVAGASATAAAVPAASQAVQAVLSDRTPQERYQAAYPVATKLTASKGLRGFRLNLAVEQAMNYQQLCELAPRIKDIVSPGEYLELHRSLYG